MAALSRVNAFNLMTDNMEEVKINATITGAKQSVLDNNDFNPVEPHSMLPSNPEASQTSFHKDHTLTLLEELPRDKSEKALSEIPSTLFIHAGAPTVSSENLALPKGTVNGPVSHSALPTSSVNAESVSLTTGQSSGQRTDSHELVQPTSDQPQISNQVLFSLPDLPNTNILSHSINKLPTSDSFSSCEKDMGDNLKTGGSLKPQIELCQDTKVELVKEEGEKGDKSPARVPEATATSISENDGSHQDPQEEVMQLPVNDEAADKPPIQCVVRTEKRRKRKMDVSKITRYFPEESYNDLNDSPEKLQLMDVESSNLSDEQQLDMAQSYTLSKLKSEPIFDDSGECFPDETVDEFEDYMFSPISFIDDASLIHANDFPSNTFNEGDHPFYVSANSGDQEPSFYPCTKCNVNFREKKHLHRHMMYHLEGNSHFRHLNIPRPYACKECGRTFRDRNSLLKHMVIHQERRQKLMEEIRELKELQDEGRGARFQCPQCVFGTNCPKTFVQHAKTHEKDKQYYCCEECNFMAITENELGYHRSIVHGTSVHSSVLSNELSQRKTQKNVLEKSTFLLPSKTTPAFMCRLCPFTTSARSILKKHMEYLHPASSMDQFNNHVIIENRESDITSELLDFGNQTKQFLKQTAFPKNSVSKQDLKRAFGSASQLSSFTKLHKMQNKFIQKTRKETSQEERYFPHTSPNKSLLIKNDQKPRYFNQIEKQKSDLRLSSAYLHKRDQHGMTKSPSHLYDFHLKKEEGRPVNSVHLFPPQGNKQNNGIILDSYNPNTKKADFSKDRRVSIQNIKTENLDTEDELDSYSDFLNDMTVVVLQKVDPSGKKDNYDTEDESSWDNVELSDYASKATENETYKNSASKTNLLPLFKTKLKDQRADHETNVSSQNKDDFYFEYYDHDAEGRFVRALHEGEQSENAETALPNHNSIFDWSDLSLEKKNCPYCPAIFETGVGLSNHVRGHLHRAGLTYEARHVVSPEQIATNDKMQHFKRVGTPIKRIRKAIEKSENSSEHTCQLCGGWFDTKIGLSNHVRGHLKRLGKTKWDAHKSPICVLNEMLQDEEKCEKMIKALNSRRNIHRPYASRKFVSSDDVTATVLPPEAHHNGILPEVTPVQSLHGQQLTNEYNEMASDPCSENRNPALTLIELLKNKPSGDSTTPDNSPQKIHNQTARKRFNQKCILPINEDCSLVYQPPTSADCSVIECKQKKSRSGSKKKGLQLPHGAEEVYILRCRFCGLVFKGPLSVQEDWIKHLQRHIVNANLPRTGAGMVEVASMLKPPSISETSFSLLMAEAAS
ncbi:zinc finger protein 644 isoform X3 [Pleurodeles waltl]|uniref:zinc finger protein 644 isoform X3 n=2 Tax=Pleurodeles waltl TaxID=8319 RepID=UPI003709AF4A